MARQRKEKEPKVKLKQPDRSGPSTETLLDIAEKHGLAKAQQERQAELEAEDEEVLVGRLGDSVLWTISLVMLHFTLDVLVTHQYAVELVWSDIILRTAQAFPVIWLLVYSFHPHREPSVLLPRLPPKIQPIIHEIFFFIVSLIAGCYLIYATNEHGYFAIMKRAPPIGTIWIWAVIELNILWAVPSAFICFLFLKLKGYAFL